MRPQEAVAWGLVLRPQSMVLAGCEPESVAAQSEHRLRECIVHELQKVNHVAVHTHAEVRNATAGCEWGLDSMELHFGTVAVIPDELNDELAGASFSREGHDYIIVMLRRHPCDEHNPWGLVLGS